MKKNPVTVIISAFAILALMASCQPRIDGRSEEEFRFSREKVRSTLNPSEQLTLEKALRVITQRASKELFSEQDTSELNLNEHTLQLMNKKTYNQLVLMAEDLLKKENERENEQLKDQIIEIEKQLANIRDIKPENLELLLNKDWFGKNALVLKYNMDFPEKGTYAVNRQVWNLHTNEVLAHQITEIRVSETANPFSDQMIIGEKNWPEGKQPFLMKAVYPLHAADLETYDLSFRIFAVIHSGEITNEIHPDKLKRELVKLKTTLSENEYRKGTLDEME